MFPFVLLAIVMLAGIWGASKLMQLRRGGPRQEARLTGYVDATSSLRQEYVRYYGKPLSDSEVVARFETAGRLVAKSNYGGAIASLESVSNEAALPLVFTDLGVLYSALGDNTHAVDNLRNALSRDFDYPAARQFLRDRKQIGAAAADPLRSEVEPNNDWRLANLIAIDSTVSGDVGDVSGDVDYFRLAAPKSPRDLVTVELINNTPNFTPRLHITDAGRRTLDWGERISRRGESLKVSGAPAPNTTLYIAVNAFESQGGSYLLRVTAEKAYDRYEPNDDILDARRIAIGEEIAANIMDPADTDYYSFVSPRKGTVTLEVRNRSTTLVPGFSAYDPDRRVEAHGPALRKPGTNVRETFKVEKDLVYYIQVSSQVGTAGAYTLRVD